MKNNIAQRLADRLTEFMLENQEKEFNILYNDLFKLFYTYILNIEIIDKRLIDNIGSLLIDIRTCIENNNI